MSNSLIKYAGRSISSGGKRLFWGRAGQDGAPYRGHYAPLMGDEEFEAKAVRICDARNAFFDVMNDEQNELYLSVLDRCMNGWFRLIHLERFYAGSTKHYVEWAEYYMEDGNRTPFSTSGIMEMSHGAANVPGDLG